jgi:hypothetical protein
MRCILCNASLSDYESTIKHAVTGKFLDICQTCFASMDVDIPIYDRKDLLHEADLPSMSDLLDNYEDYTDLGDDEHYDER